MAHWGFSYIVLSTFLRPKNGSKESIFNRALKLKLVLYNKSNLCTRCNTSILKPESKVNAIWCSFDTLALS